MGYGTFQIGTNYEQATNVYKRRNNLIAKYNRFDESVEIGDLNNASDGWVTYDPTQGASSEELTEICNTLYDRCLLAELGIKGFTPAGEQHLIKS